MGSFCPLGTRYSNQYLCPPGTYSNVSGIENVDNCTLCPPGHYCEADGMTAPSGLCEAGYFCKGGSIISTPFSSGGSLQIAISYIGLACSSVLNDTMNDICPSGK